MSYTCTQFSFHALTHPHTSIHTPTAIGIRFISTCTHTRSLHTHVHGTPRLHMCTSMYPACTYIHFPPVHTHTGSCFFFIIMLVTVLLIIGASLSLSAWWIADVIIFATNQRPAGNGCMLSPWS